MRFMKVLSRTFHWNTESAYAYNFIKKDTLTQVFSCEFCEIFKNTFSYGTPPVAASRNTRY